MILPKLRGTSDRAILERVDGAEGLVLLTQDGDFEEMPPNRENSDLTSATRPCNSKAG